jgi:glycosyltransferase involved in cell wall biosynthesis
MACQRPVVSTRVGGITDVVLDGETGLLVPPNNPDELANAVSKIVADPKLGEHMGEAGRRRVEDRFTWDKVAVETLSVYNEVTE